MASDATIRVAITSDNSSLKQGLNESQSKLGAFGKTVGKMTLVAGAAATVGLARLGAASVQAASDAQQSLGATETVFGRFSKNVIATSNQAATALGLSANDYRENANVLGSLLANQGVSADKLAGKTKGLIKTGADLAATFGGTTSDAVDALASAFKGEFDPLEKYGISIKQSTINTEAYRVAGVKTTSAFNKLSSSQQTAAKQQATTNLLMEQSKKTQGAFASESETLAHQQQVLGAGWDDLKVKIGTALLPVITKLLVKVNTKLMPALSKLADKWLPKVRRALEDWISGDDPGKKMADIGEELKGIDWGSATQGLGDLKDTIVKLGPALEDVSVDSVNDSLKVFTTVVGFASDHVDTLKKALPFLVAGFVAIKGAQLANNLIGKDSLIGFALQLGATRSLTVANKQLAAAVREVNTASSGTAGPLGRAGGAAGTATSKMSKLAEASKGVAGIAGLGAIAYGASTSNDAVGTLSTTLGGAATGFAVGGPIGAAVGGLGGLLFSLSTKFEDSGIAARDAYARMAATDSVKAATASMEDLKDSLDQVTGAYTENTRAAVLKKLQDDGLIEAGKKYGLTAREMVNAALGQKGALSSVTPVLQGYDKQIADADKGLQALAVNQQNFDADGHFTKTAQAHANKLLAQKKAAEAAKAELEKMPGVLAKDAAEIQAATAATADYSGKLKGIPKAVRTKIKTEGLAPTVKAIANLANKYKLTPKQIRTLIKATGVDATVKDVRHVQRRLKETGNTKPNFRPYKQGIRDSLDEAKGIAYRGSHGVGTAMKQGAHAGLSGVGALLANTFSTAVTTAINAAHKAAKAHSPSRETYDLGRDLGLGMVIGLDSMSPQLSRAGASASHAALGGMAIGRQNAAPLAAGSAAAVPAAAAPPQQLRPKETPVQVLLDGAVIADRLDLRRSLAAVQSARRTA